MAKSGVTRLTLELAEEKMKAQLEAYKAQCQKSWDGSIKSDDPEVREAQEHGWLTHRVYGFKDAMETYRVILLSALALAEGER